MILKRSSTYYGSLRSEDRTRLEGAKDKSKTSTQRMSRLQAYCLCGRKLCDTTPSDIWDGIQPRCEECITW
jgi:hypothetical protein